MTLERAIPILAAMAEHRSQFVCHAPLANDAQGVIAAHVASEADALDIAVAELLAVVQSRKASLSPKPPAAASAARKCVKCGWTSDGHGDSRWWVTSDLCSDCATDPLGR